MQRLITSEIMAFIRALETALPVSDWRYGDVPLWPLIRMRVYYSLSRYTQFRRFYQMRSILHYAMACIRNMPKQFSPIKPADVILLSDGVSYRQIEHVNYDYLCDPVIDTLASRSIRSELLTRGHMLPLPRYRKSRYTQFFYDLKQMWRILLPAHEKVSLEHYDLFLSKLADYGLNGRKFSRRSIIRLAKQVYSSADYYANWLDRIQPKLAFVVDYTNPHGMGFIMACRKKSIPVVDIQHGVQSQNHPGYTHWDYLGEHGSVLLPDYFWVWKESDAKNIRAWQQGKTSHMPLIGGNPWVEKGPDESLDHRYDAISPPGVKLQILVTLQDALLDDEFIEPLSRFIHQTPSHVGWWIRLHPAMMWRLDELTSRFEGTDRIFVRAPSTLPLYPLLRKAALHITHSSSCVLDAGHCGVRSIITSQYGAELFPEEVSCGEAVYIAWDDSELTTRLYELAIPFYGHSQRPLMDATLDHLLSVAGI